MARPRNKKPQSNGHKAEGQIIGELDRYARFKEFEQSLMPEIRKDLADGLKAEDIIKKYSAHAAARLVTDALSLTSVVGSNAAKEILDRDLGKATQKTDVTHRYEKLKDEELDALLQSRFTELENTDDKKDVQ